MTKHFSEKIFHRVLPTFFKGDEQEGLFELQ